MMHYSPQQYQMNSQPVRAFAGHHQYGAQTISRSSNIAFGHNPQTLTTNNNNNKLASYYDPQSLAIRQKSDRMPLMIPNSSATMAAYPASARHHQSTYEVPMSSTYLDRPQSYFNRPLCRCRVMYLGSSVPHITKNGLHGIQEPLKHLYPEEQFNPNKTMGISNPANRQVNSNTIDISHLSSSLGIDSWLSVWSNGLLLENVDEFGREIKRFFSIESLHYCAAVRFFDTSNLMSSENQQQQQQLNNNGNEDPNNNNINEATKSSASQTRKSVVRFLPLDAPIFQCPGMLDANHPPVFAAIMRRTTGIKVLECHAFICRRDAAANALVRCCTHAYADFLNAKRLSVELGFPIDAQHQQQQTQKTRSKSLVGNRRSSHGINQHTVEAIVNASSTNKGSSTGNTSNEADNSLEGSVEDNYAIIPKQHSQQHQQSDSSGHQQVNGSNNNISRKRRSRRDQSSGSQSRRRSANSEKTKGSSRSLFNDFMPKPIISDHHHHQHKQQQQQQQQHRNCSDMEKLSQSLDYLQMSACCNGTASDELDNDIQYSVVKNKRHSKSMQNLDGPFEFDASMAKSSHSNRSNTTTTTSTTTRNRHRRNETNVCGSISIRDHRKAASFQDMTIGRKDSVSSDVTAQSFVTNRDEHSSLREDSSRIYATCNGTIEGTIATESGSQPSSHLDERITMMNEKQQRSKQSNSNSNSNRRPHHRQDAGLSVSSKTSRKRRGLSDVEQNLMLKSPHPSGGGGYYAAHQAAPYGVPPHHMYMAGQLGGPAIQYMPYYIGQQPGFAGGPHYGNLAHHQHHQQPLYATPTTIGYDNPLAAYTAPAHNYAIGPHLVPNNRHHLYGAMNGMATISNGGRSKSKSALAKFRCLSPPVNFLSSSKQKHNKNNTSPPSTSTDQTINVAVKAAMATGSRNEPSSGNQNNIDTIEPISSPDTSDNVISAQPGFISSQTGTTLTVAGNNNNNKHKKMSWIKRLSLTMTSGLSGDESDTGGAATLSTNPAGGNPKSGATEANKRRRKRSSLFSGSLTLGRTKEHPKLMTSP